MTMPAPDAVGALVVGVVAAGVVFEGVAVVDVGATTVVVGAAAVDLGGRVVGEDPFPAISKVGVRFDGRRERDHVTPALTTPVAPATAASTNWRRVSADIRRRGYRSHHPVLTCSRAVPLKSEEPGIASWNCVSAVPWVRGWEACTVEFAQGHLDGDDEALAERVAVGDTSAFAELYRRHHVLAWNVARAGAVTHDAAVAAAVEGIVAAFGRRPPNAPTFRATLCLAVRRAVMERRGRRRPLPPRDIDLRMGDAAGDAAWDADAVRLADHPELEARELLQVLVDGLPPPPPELWALVSVAWQDARPIRTNCP
jgi:DNA-directed RNA polymerase specialized sigma24 family protein